MSIRPLAAASTQVIPTEHAQAQKFADLLVQYINTLPSNDKSELRHNFNTAAISVRTDPDDGSLYVGVGLGDEEMLSDNPAIDELEGFFAQCQARGVREFPIGRYTDNE